MDRLHSFRDWVGESWEQFRIKWYEIELENKRPEEVEAFKARRVQCYFAICAWGLGSMFFGQGVSSIEIVYKAHPLIAYGCVLFFLALFLCMAIGAAAAFFPSYTPFDPIDITGFGAWISVVRAVACYHLDTYEFHPEPHQAAWAITSFVITSVIVSVHWASTAQDPRFLYVTVKLLSCLLRGIWYLLRALGMIAVGWITDQFARICASVRARAGYQPLPNHP